MKAERVVLNFIFFLSVLVSGYFFSSEVVATMERYNKEMAGSVMAKAQKVCDDFGEVRSCI